MALPQASQAISRALLAEAAVSRRAMLQYGVLGLAGLTLPHLLADEAVAASPSRRRRAKSCILFFLEGGPSHIDLWDMKPDAAAEYRGDFRPIATTVPGIQVCEHLPLLARQMDHVSLVRSVHHTVVDHNAGAYYALTGRSPIKSGGLIVRPEPDNFPPYGAVLSKLRPADTLLPSFVHLPDIMSNNSYDLPGQTAGFLGGAYDPLVAGDPSVPDYQVPGMKLRAETSPDRLRRRFELLDRINEQDRKAGSELQLLRGFQQQAYDMLCSDKARSAFNLNQEPARVRERYGLRDRTDHVETRKFGGLPHLGQCMLLARRLIEAGTRLVTVGTGRRLCQAWDTHRDHFPLLKQSLLPYTDRALSALLEDLAERGMLEETLVVVMGEFGRTPKLGQITSGAGADKAGRDHWPHCYTVLLAGGGIRGGTVYGESDAIGAFPASNPVTPEDIAATIYEALGLDPEQLIADRFGRPQALAVGRPISALFG